MVRFRLLLVFLLCCASAWGQEAVRLRFEPRVGGEPLKLYEGESSGQLQITMLRCYISGISLWKDGKEVWKEPASYHLLDAAYDESFLLALNVPQGVAYDRLTFQLGIDSATSSTGAHGGDLDPVRGMYWAWQSGYINFKLEGISPQSTARKHQFHFHLGGYQAPYASAQEMSFAVQPTSEIVVTMDLDKFLNGIDLTKQNSIMIPGEEAFYLSKKAAGIFKASYLLRVHSHCAPFPDPE